MRNLFLFSLLLSFTFCTGTMTNPSVETKTYLALGDSYTVGEGVSVKESWPYQLTERLRDAGISMDAPRVIARTGWRTDNLVAAIEAENLTEKFDLVSVLIGVNNQFQGKSLEVYKKDLRGLLNRAIGLSRKGESGVFVLSIPDYGSTPFGKLERESIGKEIDEWNLACKSVCDELGIMYLDITQISKKAAVDTSLTGKDRLHPSGKMYALWVDEILEKVSNLLR